MSVSTMMKWVRGHIPTRDSIAANRWLAPFADRLLKPDLWHFNRRSVPRAVALGLFVAPIVPVAHTFVAALLALPVRANIVIALVITWVINPLTIPPFYYAAFQVGRFLLHLDKGNSVGAAIDPPVHTANHWLAWVLHVTGPAALGTVILATLASAVGYLASTLIWRLRIARKWRRRPARRHGPQNG
ncbi:MAG: hypothetical protein JWO15_3142 [Sphingomonadales bacterium]|nr:hypothetical protein [Sphingomonadales bacterium]